jgi:catechol 2,3-dioxygenase-like lactoylglutathione lyase family enzyme
MSFAHLTLATRDVRGSVEFFSTALGWRPIDRPNNIGRPAAWLEMAPGEELHLIEVQDFAPSPFEQEFGRHLAVAFPQAQFADLRRRLTEQGAQLIEPLRPTPFERFFFRDPNGYVFEIVAAERTVEADASRFES